MLIWAHRGYSAKYPENSLLAFEKAIEYGADGIEFDIHLSKDNKLVVCHDFEFGRTTSNPGKVGDYTLDELTKMDCGSWKNQSFDDQNIPSLQQVLSIVPDDFVLNIEMKYQSFRDDGKTYKQCADQLIPLITEHSQYIVSSFDIDFLAYLRKENEKLKLGYLDHASNEKGVDITRAKEISCFSYHPDQSKISNEQIRELKNNDLKVFCYTVNDPDRGDELNNEKVDGIITNEVELLTQRIRHT
jgi:glycerophosphoryl diester phosphodiesterase